MNQRFIMALFVSVVVLTSSLGYPLASAQQPAAAVSPPPIPPYMLTSPRVNEITYTIVVKNINTSWVTIDFALPKTWTPDTYIKLKDIQVAGATTVMNYTDRENIRMRTYTSDFSADASVTINVTFYSLKYKLEYLTDQLSGALGYPNELAMYAQPENYIESNDSLIMNKALALVKNETDPFYIAQKMYNFALSYVTYVSQRGIRGALWALQNGTGDCTEFGTLFVALMRAVGIPARTVIGHVASELANGGVANASSLSWVRSPHLWAEFYVDGYGWVPVDPTNGRKQPSRHFGITWGYYLPFIKGPTMDDPSDTLVYVRYEPETRIKYESYLAVTPLNSMPFEEKSIQDFVAANELSNTMKSVASRAYHYSFDIADTYPLLENTYSSLVNATKAIDDGNDTLSSEYSLNASSSANLALNTISNIVLNEATLSINRAWKDLRILGALGGGLYLRMAEDSRNRGDYQGVVLNAYFAEVTADEAPSIIVFLGPLLFCIFTVGMIRRNHHKTKSANKPSQTVHQAK